MGAFEILCGVDVDREATFGQPDPSVASCLMRRCRTRAELRTQSPTEQQRGAGARRVGHETVVRTLECLLSVLFGISLRFLFQSLIKP